MSTTDTAVAERPQGKIYSQEDIEAQLVFLDRSHKMTSSDHLRKETSYSRSAGIIRQLLESNGENP